LKIDSFSGGEKRRAKRGVTPPRKERGGAKRPP